MQSLLRFVKKEIVLCISFFLALVSVVFVPPDSTYLSYIDFHTLAILMSLMLIMAGLQSLGIFGMAGRKLLQKTSNVRNLTFVLVLLSMLITNDVALITFVPFTIEVLAMAGLENYLIRVIVLQTIASNLGSMLTPVGNPQNLYLFSLSGMGLGQFVLLMLPYTLLSLAGLLIACIILTERKPVTLAVKSGQTLTPVEKRKTAVYLLLFLFAMTSVAHLLPDLLVWAVIVLAVLLMDSRILRRPDYALLMTFVFLFVFIGNMKGIPAINIWLRNLINGHELITSVLASQVISNVPAAILLSGFTDNLPPLIIGANLGGLGPLSPPWQASFLQILRHNRGETKRGISGRVHRAQSGFPGGSAPLLLPELKRVIPSGIISLHNILSRLHSCNRLFTIQTVKMFGRCLVFK
ncbi:MAG: SLC13 family permease [Oscillospiraceae bacterium]